MNDTDTQNQVADSNDIISQYVFMLLLLCFFLSLEFGPDKAYSVFSDIPTQSTLLSKQNGKREEGEKKNWIP